jgi:molecular chaperone IbpA
MVSSFALDLFKDPFFIGFNRELERLNTVHNLATRQAYPPYDIIKVDEDTYKLSLAVAGFDEENLNVSVDSGTLIVKGETSDTEEGEVVYKGIASRKFTRTFALGEYMEVTGAEICCGMLNINIERIVPEDKKPKQIKVKVAK